MALCKVAGSPAFARTKSRRARADAALRAAATLRLHDHCQWPAAGEATVISEGLAYPSHTSTSNDRDRPSLALRETNSKFPV